MRQLMTLIQGLKTYARRSSERACETPQEKPAGLFVQDTSGCTSVMTGLWDAPILVGPEGHQDGIR